MSDVSKIKGPVPRPEPEKAKKKEGADVEKIKEKWSKVGKVDPDQRKQKKARAQEEEETKQKLTAAPRQGLEAEPKEPSLYEPAAGKEPPVGEGVGAGPLPPSKPPPYFPQVEEGLEVEGPGAPKPAEKKEEAKPAPKKKPVEKKEIAKKKKVAKEEPAPKLEKEKKEKVPTLPTQLEKEAETLAKEAAKVPKAEEKIEKPEKKEEEIQAAPPPPEPFPKGAWEATKEAEKEEKVEKEEAKPPPTTTLPTELKAGPPPTAVPTPAPPPLAAPFANLAPQVQQLFQRMVGVMTVMHESGITTTTFNLDTPQYAESPFYQAQIIITEFSTAPKTFNIELLGNQQAVNLMSTNAEELVAAFQAGNYNFKVNRIDTGYLPPVGEAKRKKVGRVKRKKMK